MKQTSAANEMKPEANPRAMASHEGKRAHARTVTKKDVARMTTVSL